jgi:hypothetical protein
MTRDELIQKIKSLTPSALSTVKKAETTAIEYDELTKFPELKAVIVDLLTADYGKFIDSIDWVAPKPTTFRINLLNGESFYLIWNKRSWVAEVEGKRYYLLNLPEEGMATKSIARMLRYGIKVEEEGVDVEGAEEIETETEEIETETEEIPAEA